MTNCQMTCKSLKKVIMLFSRSGFDVSRASWEFPEGTCAGYNGEQRMMFLIMMTKTRMLMMSMTMTVMMTMMMLILVLIHNSNPNSIFRIFFYPFYLISHTLCFMIILIDAYF